MCPKCVRVLDEQTTTNCRFAGAFLEPSDGLEPSTPSLRRAGPCRPASGAGGSALRWVDSKLTVISPEALDLLLALPGVAKTLLEQLAVTLGQKQEALGYFGSRRHIDRVRRKLLQLARNYGRVALDGVRIDFPLSHTLLADMVGSSRETVTRSLDELRRDGFVARRGHTYRLLVSPTASHWQPSPSRN
jgi:biotin operon repressor